MSVEQMPTLPGKAEGIVGWDPCVLQCRGCGATTTQEGGRVGFFILLSGYRFHTCEERKGVRRCPDCLTAAERDCPNKGRHS